ncbi:host RecBCD nuclease inhibitor [Bacillus phage PBC2]|uniref:Uncharacterized protein n=1 Tax=Bacillus phage PBC2 TaxID=1675029 RepID=A0A218KC44_9CAUD|nr:host RecBCD nuclease inhibitor [Bacillus phage PBC2]AKQ08460.1 hypothetical protein PBC2_145 [Bacillus phage PBC2]
MKRWEIVKGIQEGLYPKGTRFKIKYDDGDVAFAVIDQYGCLAWDMEDGNGHVHIASYNGDEWTILYDNLKDREEDEDKFVTIKQSQLDYLEERVEFLNCLEACGVDNWEGYGNAYQMLEEDE